MGHQVGVVRRGQYPTPFLLRPSCQGASSLTPLPSRTHQAAAEVHQARLRKSAMVGYGRKRGMGCRCCPWTRVTPALSSEVGGRM